MSTFYHPWAALFLTKTYRPGFVFFFPRSCESETCEKQSACQTKVTSGLHERVEIPYITHINTVTHARFIFLVAWSPALRCGLALGARPGLSTESGGGHTKFFTSKVRQSIFEKGVIICESFTRKPRRNELFWAFLERRGKTRES